MPYSLTVAAIVLAAGYLPATTGLTPWISLTMAVGLSGAVFGVLAS